jgi:hypothetical protein
MRPGEAFGIICGPDQLERMRRVIAHNGGADTVERTESDAVYLVVRKLPHGGEE